MIYTIHSPTAEQLLDKAGAWLEQEEAQNNLILGILLNIAKKPLSERQVHRFFLAEENGKPAGVAAWTPPYHLAMTNVPAEAHPLLAEKLFSECPDLPGVSGPEPTMKLITPILGRRFQKNISFQKALRIFQLQKTASPAMSRGIMKKAQEKDLEFLNAWYEEFTEEVHMPEHVEKRPIVEGYIREQRLFFWEDKKPVAMAGYSGKTPHGVRVNMVYTPPPMRNRGYATSLVATLSRLLLDSGKQFCVLFTDLSNPVSNAIYQRIGYRVVCDWDMYGFQAENKP
jgi:predicted GNAT family acetyltransferase